MGRATLKGLAQGWATWILVGWMAWNLPGEPWRASSPGPFPWGMAVAWCVGFGLLGAGGLLGALLGGPGLATRRWLAIVEALPAMVWGIGISVLWPGTLGAPGFLAWLMAFLLCGLPCEMRWMAQALPPEMPFPGVYGQAFVLKMRALTLRRLVVPWALARWPVWLVGTLVLERILGCRGLGSDWAERVVRRDRPGMLLWVGVLMLLWTAAEGLGRGKRCS